MVQEGPAWNDYARISCEFKFKCPKVWHLLKPTPTEGIRHCPECDRNVYLSLTEEEFRCHAQQGHCVAVPVTQPEVAAEAGEGVYLVGMVEAPYSSGDETSQTSS